MKKMLFLFLGVFFSNVVFAQWSNWFNVSDQQYKIYIVSDDNFNVTQGYYITNFPCYGQYNQEYYKTIVGKNMITLFCLQPPTEVYLTYITKPIGSFVSRNAIDAVMPYTDVFLYDIKAIDEDVHKKCTGQSNKQILDNLKYIDDCGKNIEIRIPYVP